MNEAATPHDSLVAVQAPAAPPEPVYIQDSEPPAVAIVVPLAFFLMVLGLVVGTKYMKFRTRKLVQEERMRAMELHIPVPPEPHANPGNPYIMPMLLIGAGLGLVVLWANVSSDDAVVALGFGAISLLSGAAWLGAVKLNSGTRHRLEKLAETESQAYVAALERTSVPPAPPTPPTPPSI